MDQRVRRVSIRVSIIDARGWEFKEIRLGGVTVVLACATVFEDFVEHVSDGAGAGADGLLRGLEAAGEGIVTLARGAEFVGDVEGCEDGYAEAIDGASVGGDGTHFCVDDLGEALDVSGVGSAEIIDLIVDIDCDGLTCGGLGWSLWRFEGLVHCVSFAWG